MLAKLVEILDHLDDYYFYSIQIYIPLSLFSLTSKNF